VKYVDHSFDLKIDSCAFNFVFQLFNFVSMANEDSHTLCNAPDNVAKLHADITQMSLPTLTALANQKRKRNDDDAGNGSSKKKRSEGGPVESDILSDVAILEALERAGYTISGEVEGFESLLPVRTSFP
jgi:hypothetical protein